MTDVRIIYVEDDGMLVILTPCLHEINPVTGKNFTADEVAKKDIPKGKKYKILKETDIPFATEREFRDAWTVDESILTDGEGEQEV
tara:strand:+ start:333 stop:590 length:258 start_codon:yes stop_codon:yes gene_type:complete